MTGQDVRGSVGNRFLVRIDFAVEQLLHPEHLAVMFSSLKARRAEKPRAKTNAWDSKGYASGSC
jgi:hypothetical protein